MHVRAVSKILKSKMSNDKFTKMVKNILLEMRFHGRWICDDAICEIILLSFPELPYSITSTTVNKILQKLVNMTSLINDENYKEGIHVYFNRRRVHGKQHWFYYVTKSEIKLIMYGLTKVIKVSLE